MGDGLRAGEGVVVVATPENLRVLESRLATAGFDLNSIRSSEQFIPIDADLALSEFMVDGWPDESRFRALAAGWIARARGRGRAVRAFGEMVALLWAGGRNAATIRLEHLWHLICEEQAFCLLCAYPKAGFKPGTEISVREICEAHSQVLAA